MGKMFSQAEAVIPWLGEGSERISKLFERVEESSLRHAFGTQSKSTAVSMYESAVQETRSASRPVDEVWSNPYEDFGSTCRLLLLQATGAVVGLCKK